MVRYTYILKENLMIMNLKQNLKVPIKAKQNKRTLKNVTFKEKEKEDEF
jgi:hypothetical protein